MNALDGTQLYCEMNAKLGRVVKETEDLFGNNCTDKLAELEARISTISKEVNERQRILDVELDQINNLILKLGEPSLNMALFSGPAGTHELSDIRLNLMKDYKAKLTALASVRREDIKTAANDCFQLFVQLVVETEVIFFLKCYKIS